MFGLTLKLFVSLIVGAQAVIDGYPDDRRVPPVASSDETLRTVSTLSPEHSQGL
jgi:hypothetical protein